MRRSAFVLAAALLALCAVPPARAYTDAEISQFLTSSPWCHFRYSSAGGSTTTRRGQFCRDGVLVVRSGREVYSSGPGGTYAGGSQGGERYYWRVQNATLLLSQDGASWQPYTLDAYRNSSGYPILVVGGDEYSMCE
jgi:hypothetical protein